MGMRVERDAKRLTGWGMQFAGEGDGPVRPRILPHAVTYFVIGGRVVKVKVGGVRMPKTLMWAPTGVSNSTVPRMFAVTGN